MLAQSPFLTILVDTMVTNVCLSGTWEISRHHHLPVDHDRILKHWALKTPTVSHVNDEEHKITA